jgi:UDP-glucuronate decarboxylase
MASGQDVIFEDVVNVSQQCPSLKRLDGSAILITGASGMLASYMVHSVLWLNRFVFQNPCTIFAAGRDFRKLVEKYGYALDFPYFHLLVGNTVKDFAEKCREVEFIVHAASPASPNAYIADPIGTIRCNSTMVDQLLEWGYEIGIKGFLYFSSGAVYGDTGPGEVPTPETFIGRIDPLGERSCYVESKRCGETICFNYWKFSQMPTKVVRPAHTYGPGVNLDDSRVFASFLRNGLQGQAIEVKGDGKAKRTFCYLADANVAFWKVLLDGADGEVYNVGNDQAEITIMEFAQIVAHFFEVEVKVKGEREPGLPGIREVAHRRLLDIGKLKGLGFCPRYGVEEGLQRVILSLRS